LSEYEPSVSGFAARRLRLCARLCSSFLAPSSAFSRFIDKVATFLLGIINNTPYVIGIASANKIVDSFHVEGAVGIVLAANTVSGLFSRFLNSWLISRHVPYGATFWPACVRFFKVVLV
jgi:hypothetical protein